MRTNEEPTPTGNIMQGMFRTRIGSLRKTFNDVLSEVANGSRVLPVAVRQEQSSMTYQIKNEGVTMVVHIIEEQEGREDEN